MQTHNIDQNELKFMQGSVMAVLSFGFVMDAWAMIALQVIIFALTILNPALNPFIAVYRALLRPRNIIHANWRMDNRNAHRFAAIIGFFISSASVIALHFGHDTLGWGLVWLILVFGVFALQGWCAGCYSYYLINRLWGKG